MLFKKSINKIVILRGLATIVFIGCIFCGIQPSFGREWYLIQKGKLFGVSGLAYVPTQEDLTTFLIVHDSKGKKEGRLGLVMIDRKGGVQYIPIAWPDTTNQPIDLEAITAFPDKGEDSFIVMASEGKCYHLLFDLVHKKVDVIKEFSLPTIGKGNFEGFALKKLGATWVAVWASRGNDDQPAIMYYGIFDPAQYSFSEVKELSIKVIWPRKSVVRHVSDIVLNEYGNVFISSASDPGDTDVMRQSVRFQSAVYMIGQLIVNGTQLSLTFYPRFVCVYRCEDHKIEGIDFLEKETMIYGADDDDQGGWIGPKHDVRWCLRSCHKGSGKK